MQCNGGEKSVELCKSRGWGNSDCTHDEDAGVVCKDERIPGFVDSNVIEVSVFSGKVMFIWKLLKAHKPSPGSLQPGDYMIQSTWKTFIASALIFHNMRVSLLKAAGSPYVRCPDVDVVCVRSFLRHGAQLQRGLWRRPRL